MKECKKINLAIQGGGAFGALSWGALDRILEEESLEIDGISATSSGSLTAAVLMQGHLENGREGARKALRKFWEEISLYGQQSGFGHTIVDILFGSYMPAPFSILWFKNLVRNFSPYQFNPLNINLLEDILKKLIDFKQLKKHSPIKLFICATNVKTGKIKIFHNEDISVKTILASACLPYIFQAVEINKEYYWDGGYMGNPAIYPLIFDTNTTDILLLHASPKRSRVPMSSEEILMRTKELAFNSSMVRELQVIEFITNMIDRKVIKKEFESEYKRIYMHNIEFSEISYSVSSINSLNTNWSFLLSLHKSGRRMADKWIKNNYQFIGKKSTLSLL